MYLILLWYTSSPLYMLTSNFRDCTENHGTSSHWELEGVCSSDRPRLLFKHSCYNRRWEIWFSLQQSIFSNLIVWDTKHLQNISSNIKVFAAFNYSAQFEKHLQQHSHNYSLSTTE